MFTLPRCPHCGMHFSYKYVLSGHILGVRTCSHCKKTFRARLSGATVFCLSAMFVLCLLVNFLLLRYASVNGIFISVVSLFFIVPALLLTPMTVRYKDEQGKVFARTERTFLGSLPDAPVRAGGAEEKRKHSKSVRRRMEKERQK